MDPQSGQKQGKWRFLLFDAIVISGKRLHDRPYSKRLAYIDQEIIRPRQALAVGGGSRHFYRRLTNSQLPSATAGQQAQFPARAL